MRETFEANRQGRVASHGSRITFHESRFTITVHESRFTNHGSRITVHESRFTHHESRITLPLHKAVPVVHNQKRTRRCYLASTLIPMEDTMAQVIPENYLDLFQKKAFAHLATINEDGTPQVTPVWIDYDGNHVLVNSARGRRKDKNMERNSAVALSIQDPDNPYRYLEVRVLYKITPERISHMGLCSADFSLYLERGPDWSLCYSISDPPRRLRFNQPIYADSRVYYDRAFLEDLNWVGVHFMNLRADLYHRRDSSDDVCERIFIGLIRSTVTSK